MMVQLRRKRVEEIRMLGVGAVRIHHIIAIAEIGGQAHEQVVRGRHMGIVCKMLLVEVQLLLLGVLLLLVLLHFLETALPGSFRGPLLLLWLAFETDDVRTLFIREFCAAPDEPHQIPAMRQGVLWFPLVSVNALRHGRVGPHEVVQAAGLGRQGLQIGDQGVGEVCLPLIPGLLLLRISILVILMPQKAHPPLPLLLRKLIKNMGIPLDVLLPSTVLGPHHLCI
mmetsp:Transcript_20284/g.34978  ORF Transcript_20284/g.34978 Transcript_20284/m.34978 type:complete len:225 (+) Transcript_20284:1399-2073(+)